MVTRYILILACLIWLSACDREEKQRAAMIEQGVQIKLDQYRLRQESICKTQAIEKAVVIADSLMRSQGPKTTVRQGPKPPPAVKPAMPPVKQLPDSLRNDPLRKN